MGLFNFESNEVEELFTDLIRATTGTEPCYDPIMMEPLEDDSDVRPDARLNDSPTDAFVESWSGKSTASQEQAAAMCAGCDVLEQCRAYAIAAKEPHGVWGGTTPLQRGVKPRRYNRSGLYITPLS